MFLFIEILCRPIWKETVALVYFKYICVTDNYTFLPEMPPSPFHYYAFRRKQKCEGEKLP